MSLRLELRHCAFFCASCARLWPALFVPVLFASQGFAGHKEAQNSQEEVWNQPRLLQKTPHFIVNAI
jgi:hypothetical protein